MREVRLRLPRGIAAARRLDVFKVETRRRTPRRTRRLPLNWRAEDRGRGWPHRATNQRTARGLPSYDVSAGTEGHWNSRTTWLHVVVSSWRQELGAPAV